MRRALPLVLLVGCGAAPSPSDPPPAGTVLYWRVGQALWGWERLTITEEGVARYVFRPAEGRSMPPVDRTLDLSAEELATVRDALRAESVCTLDATRDGVPDEAMTHLRVTMGGALNCEVEVWDNDWGERAPRTLGLIRGWIRRARDR